MEQQQTLKCISCMKPFTVTPDENGRIEDARCPKCGLGHAGKAASWAEIGSHGLSFVAPGQKVKRFKIILE